MRKYIIFVTSLLFLSLSSSPVVILAQTASSSGQRLETREANAKNRASLEIDRRVTSLNNLIVLLSGMKKVSDSQKLTLSQQIQSEISQLQTLKTKINGDTDIETLKSDIKSIFNEYRIYMLFIPKVRILAGADKALDVASSVDSILAKIQSANISGSESLIVDIQNKLIDAKQQAQNAINMVTPLTPDQGDQAKIDSNKQALISARDALRRATSDFKIIRSDIEQIRNMQKSASSSATTTR